MKNKKTTQNDFRAFMKARAVASRAFVNGDIAPLAELSTRVSPATIFGPMGSCVEGAKEVNDANAAAVTAFLPGGKSAFEIMQSAAEGNLAFWAGVQRSSVRMKGKRSAVPMDLRVTEVFRREKTGWKLIHRHADPFKPAGKRPKK